MHRRSFLAALVFVPLALAPVFVSGAWAQAGESPVLVREVVDGDTVILDDGRQVRLVGIQAPKLALGRKNFKDWPLAEDSKRALEGLCLNRRVVLRPGETSGDRHGRVLAHLHRDDGLWVQGEMLRSGMARVYTFPDNRGRAAEMYALEAEARAARRGIWAHPFYAVRGPGDLKNDIGTFQVVAGKVLDAARVKETVYLNFGADWRTDFTLRLDAKGQRLFRAQGFDPLALKGRMVEARGWLHFNNGPMIDVSHPEQLTVNP
ncbi:MAG: thermonuclease family protein [Alphaproteobacteria bacterium]|nr:thermonuclease family protein [Alphaproteobacteria bacterium]